MARSIEQINQFIVANLVSNAAAVGIVIDPITWSKRNGLRLICYTVSVCVGLLEQLMDIFQTSVENIVARAPAASALWIQKKMFEFQYSETDPQVLTLIDVVPVYPEIKPELRIITACAVSSSQSSSVSVKMAKGSPLQALSIQELDSAQGYLNTIGVIGIEYTGISLPSDKLYVEADIFFSGQYASVISPTTIAALNAFLESLSLTNFNGALKMTDLEALIRNVEGVTDVVLKNVRGREDAASFSAGIDLILNTSTVQRQWNTIAGYIGQEDTAGKTFIDTLTFIPE